MQPVELQLPNQSRAFVIAPRDALKCYRQVQDYFSPQLLAILERRPLTIFDVGANVGFFSMEVLRRTKGEARVFSFEPIKPTFELLQRNLAQFASSSVRLFNCGLSCRAGSAVFNYFPYKSPVSTMYPDHQHDKRLMLSFIYDSRFAKKHNVEMPWILRSLPRAISSRLIDFVFRHPGKHIVPQECRLSTLSQVLRENPVSRIDLLKIDVEKAELDVLAGIEEADWDRIQAIAMEVHDIGDRRTVIEGILQRHGFRTVVSDREEGDAIFNLLAVK